jgi:hypothetical protein
MDFWGILIVVINLGIDYHFMDYTKFSMKNLGKPYFIYKILWLAIEPFIQWSSWMKWYFKSYSTNGINLILFGHSSKLMLLHLHIIQIWNSSTNGVWFIHCHQFNASFIHSFIQMKMDDEWFLYFHFIQWVLIPHHP